MSLNHKKYVKAAHLVPDGEMCTLSVRRSFMHRRASFPFMIRYACQFISFFQYIIISQASQTVTLGLVFRVKCNFSYISLFFYYYKARALSIPTINIMCGAEWLWYRAVVRAIQDRFPGQVFLM